MICISSMFAPYITSSSSSISANDGPPFCSSFGGISCSISCSMICCVSRFIVLFCSPIFSSLFSSLYLFFIVSIVFCATSSFLFWSSSYFFSKLSLSCISSYRSFIVVEYACISSYSLLYYSSLACMLMNCVSGYVSYIGLPI